MIGSNVTEMVAELAAVRKLETTGHELIKTVHHPTLSEAVMEAAAAAYDEVIHLQNVLLRNTSIPTSALALFFVFQIVDNAQT